MKKLLDGLPESFRRTISAGIPLVVVLVLFISVGKFGVSKVIDIRSQIKSAQFTESVLAQKLNLLKNISSVVSVGAVSAASAVPDSDPSLTVILQLKTLAMQNGVVVSAIKSSSGMESSSGLNQAAISFTADGVRSQLFDFLTGIAKIAPVTIVDKIQMNETFGSEEADIGVKSYWAGFPKTMPSVDSPISDLSQSEKETLSEMSGLIQPTFTLLSLPKSSEVNPNPFGQ